eukprot:970944-Pleurochrysis_carterae.AAC.5
MRARIHARAHSTTRAFVLHFASAPLSIRFELAEHSACCACMPSTYASNVASRSASISLFGAPILVISAFTLHKQSPRFCPGVSICLGSAIGRGGLVRNISLENSHVRDCDLAFWFDEFYGQHPSAGFDPTALPVLAVTCNLLIQRDLLDQRVWPSRVI